MREMEGEKEAGRETERVRERRTVHDRVSKCTKRKEDRRE